MDLDRLFSCQLKRFGTIVKINNVEKNVILKKIDSDKSVPVGKVITLEEVKNGDIILYEGLTYIIINAYKPANKPYYIGEYTLAKKVYYTDKTDIVNKKPNEIEGIQETYGALTKINSIIDDTGGVASINTNKYQVILDSSVVGINFNKGTLLSCGVAMFVQNVDKTKDKLYYYICEYEYSYNIVEENYTISLNENTINLNQTHNTYQINPICTKNGVVVDNPTIIYTSSDDTIGTVSNTGLVTVNEVSIDKTFTVTCSYMDKKAILTVNVSHQDVYGISINPNSGTLSDGETYQLTPICTKNGETVDNPTITYSCDNTNASISESGLITATGTDEEQTATITMTYEGVSCTYTLTINKIAPKVNRHLTATKNYWHSKYTPEGYDISISKRGSTKIYVVDMDGNDMADEVWTITHNIDEVNAKQKFISILSQGNNFIEIKNILGKSDKDLNITFTKDGISLPCKIKVG